MPSIIITDITERYSKHYWKGARGVISSSYSGLHFFHYKIESSDYKLRKLQADRLHLEVKGDHTFRIFFKGISVILESRPGVKEVENIRVILIIETDFKFSNKLLISVFMMRVAYKSWLITPY